MEINEVMLRELKHTISKIVREELQRYLITEMAVSLKDYRKNVESLMQQILENWCLIRYTTISGDKIEYRNYWCVELRSHMNNIASMKLKNGNHISTKQKAIYDIWNMYDLDIDENCIGLRISVKFETEGIEPKGEYFAQVVSDFKNETVKLVNILTTGNNITIKEYIENI